MAPVTDRLVERWPVHSPTPFAYALTLTVLLLVFSAASAAAQDRITASATLNSTSFGIDDAATLSITVNGTRSADVELPESDDFELIQRGRSSQFNMINGKFSSSITFTCLLRAFSPGDYTIPPITIVADDQTIATEPIPFTVKGKALSSGSGASPGRSTTTNDSSRPAYLVVQLPKEKAYIGELFPIEIKAYFKRGIRANLTSPPELSSDGVVMGQLTEKPDQTQEGVNGVMYNVLTWHTNISTVKVGNHPFQLELHAVEHVPQKRLSNSLFGRQSPFDDDFFDSMLGGYSQRPLKLTSEKRSLEVLPLPEEGRPRDFSGAIGQFHIHAQAEPTTLEQGEPITLSISVRGQGNFDRVEAPAFPEGLRNRWRIYSPASTFHPADQSGLAGEKVFEQAIVAKDSDIDQVPALSFSYFDPDKGAYVSTETKPIPIQIAADAAVPSKASQPAATKAQTDPAVQTGGKSQQTTPLAETTSKPNTTAISGLAPLHLETGHATGTIRPIYSRRWFQLYASACLFLIAAVSYLKARQLRAQGSPEEQRRRKRIRQLNNDIGTLKQLEKAGDYRTYLNQCRAVIQQHLGILWQCEPTAITSAGAAAKLPAGSKLAAVLARTEHAVYSGASLSTDEMVETTKTVKMELENLI